MQQEQIKNLLVNIMTAVVVVGVIVVGYFVFTKKDTAVLTSVVSVARIAEKTASIASEIEVTMINLKDLERAVASSTAIFDLPAFKNLQDFSLAIPSEAVGNRTNPFITTEWKLRMKATEVAPSGNSSVQLVSQSTPDAPSPSQPPAVTGGLLGNFGPGI